MILGFFVVLVILFLVFTYWYYFFPVVIGVVGFFAFLVSGKHSLTVLYVFTFIVSLICFIAASMGLYSDENNALIFALSLSFLIAPIVIPAAIYVICRNIYKRPLTDEEIARLSKKRVKNYIEENYNFKISHFDVNKDFKASMNTTGKLYEVNLPLEKAPACAAALLKGKKHEWVLMAFENKLNVTHLWMNKGDDNLSVSFNCSTDDLIFLCSKFDIQTIIRFHNHPNAHLSPSEQDMISANYLSEILNGNGVNWIDVVCGRGDYKKFFESYSDAFVPESASVETINSQNGISSYDNYKLHAELGLFTRGKDFA